MTLITTTLNLRNKIIAFLHYTNGAKAYTGCPKKMYAIFDFMEALVIIITRNSFPRYAPGAATQEDSIKKQGGRFVAMVTKDLQTLNLKFDQVMFNSLVFTRERSFEVTFGIFSVLVSPCINCIP